MRPPTSPTVCTLEETTEVDYKVDSPYAPEQERGLAWDAPAIGIEWPVGREDVQVSGKDARLPGLSGFETPFTEAPCDDALSRHRRRRLHRLGRGMIRDTAHEVLVVDALTYAGNLDNLAPVSNDPRYRFLQADIGDLAEITVAWYLANRDWWGRIRDGRYRGARLGLS